MIFFEILVIVAAILIVVAVFAKFIYNKVNGIDSECETCKSRMNKNIKKIKKELNKEYK